MATATGASDGDKYSNNQRRRGGINHRKGKTKASSRRFNTAAYTQEADDIPKASKRWMAESHPLGEMGSADDIPF